MGKAGHDERSRGSQRETADLLDAARHAVEVATSGGADFADAEASTSRGISVSVEKSSLHHSSERRGEGLSVRAVVNGGTGSAGVTRLSKAEAEEAAKRAVAAARLAEPDPDFVRLPSPEPFEEVAGLFDGPAAGLTVKELVEIVTAEVASALSVDKRLQVQAGASLWAGASAFVNSCGVRHERASTSVRFSIFPSLKDGEDVGSFFDFDSARRLEDFEPRGLGKSTAETAVSFKGARPAPTGVFTVVLGPLAAHAFLGAVAAAAGAEGILRGRSFLAGKLGERIASERITIVDDGLVPGGLGSGPLDGEGSVRKKVVVVENGVFVNELHGLYTALKAEKRGLKAECTGHGSRGGGTHPTNVQIALGERTAEEIIREVDEGIYVNYGGVVPNLVTGEISASVDFGFKIEGGRLAYPLRNTMLGVNAFELLHCVDAVSSDCRVEPGIVMPSLRAGGVRVAGGRGAE